MFIASKTFTRKESRWVWHEKQPSTKHVLSNTIVTSLKANNVNTIKSIQKLKLSSISHKLIHAINCRVKYYEKEVSFGIFVYFDNINQMQLNRNHLDLNSF